MKKILKFMLCLLVTFTSILFINENNWTAMAKTDYQYYPLSCGAYEVGYVTDAGGFSNEGCYNDLNSAINKMYQLGNDGVVRHRNSYSPTKIIAMTSGVVVSYPMRSKSNTTNLYQYADNSGKKTYVTKHREMAYFSTYSYDGNGNGKVKVNLTGFEGYINLKDVDLVPMKFVKKEMPLYLGGNDETALNEQPFYTRIYQSFYEVKQNGNYKDLVFVAHSGWSSNTWPEKFTMTLGPAADWMKVGSIYYSYNGFDFYSDREYKNKVNTYYNYYQFLPLRSKSNIEAGAYNALLTAKGKAGDSKLMNTGQIFIDNQNTYGVNAALVFAMACLESGYGTSNFAKNRNNLFGWNAYDSDPGQASYFNSINDGIREHMSINLRGYLDINDARFFGMHLGNKGSGLNVQYAADPYWGYKIAGIAYELDKINNNYNGNLTDYNKTSLGLINKYNVSFYRGNSTTSGELYKSAYGATYQSNFIVPILADEGNMVKVQSTNGVRDNNTIVYHKESGSIKPGENYNWAKSVAYLNKADVTALNFTLENNVGKVPTGDFVFNIDGLSLKDDKLTISGSSYMPGIYVNQDNKVTVKLYIKDEFLNKEALEYTLTTAVEDNDKVKFKEEIDLSKLSSDRYFFTVSTEYSKYQDYGKSVELSDTVKTSGATTFNNISYEFVKEFGTTYLDIKTVDGPEPSVEPTPTPNATPVPSDTPSPDSELILMNILNSFKYANEEKTIVNIDGIALIKGINTGEESDVSHQIVITNMESDEKFTFDLNTTNESPKIDLKDGLDYTKVHYNGDIDLTTLPVGEYTVRIQMKNGDVVKSMFLLDTNEANIPKSTVVNENIVSFNQIQMYGYRYEISVKKYQFDSSVINKPTRTTSMIMIDKLEIENNLLEIMGVSWMFNVNYKESDKASFTLKLLSNTTGEIYDYPLTTAKCELDYTKQTNSKYDRSYTCFNGSLDISELKEGNYIVYLDNSTSSKRDILEVYNILQPKYNPVTINNLTYNLKFTNVRYRLELDIKSK